MARPSKFAIGPPLSFLGPGILLIEGVLLERTTPFRTVEQIPGGLHGEGR